MARPNAIEAPRDQGEAPSRARLHAGLPLVDTHRIARQAEHRLLHDVARLTRLVHATRSALSLPPETGYRALAAES